MNNFNNQQPNKISLTQEAFEKAIKKSTDMQDALKKHIMWDNKISIWINIVNKIFPVFRNFLILILSGWYFIKDVILGDFLHKIVDLILTKINDHWTLLIIFGALTCIHLINKKYK